MLLCNTQASANGPPENDEEASAAACCFPATISPFRRSRNRAMRKRTEEQPVREMRRPQIINSIRKDEIQFSTNTPIYLDEKITWL